GLNGSATGCAIDGNYQMNDNAGNIVFQMGEPDFDTEIAHNMCVINYGCMDETACNYDSLAQMEATCFFADNYFDCEGNCLNDADGDTVCDELETEGCTDENACNFDANASDDNGSCSYIFDYLIVGEMNVEVGEIETYTYEETVGSIYNWTIDGGVILSGQGTAQITVQWTLPGTGLLSVVETNASACIGELVGVTLNISPIGVFELHESQLSVFPNPAHQHIIIDLGTMQTTSLYLFDAAGRMVCKAENVSADLYTMPLNVAAGVYALCAMSGGRWRMTVLVVE
ncbi:MAG: T9SS type A sorting domain-containing protein, partial [Flavobacteriales bacterium]